MTYRAWFTASGALTLALVALVATPKGLAAQQSGASANMQVSANVVRKCTVTAQPLAFGSYDPVSANLTAPLDAQTTVAVACTKGTAVTIGMGLGLAPTGQTRSMQSGAERMNYMLYQDASRTKVWTDTPNGMLAGGVAPSRDPRQFIVYGRINGGQDRAEGNYQDTVVVTVNF